MSTILKSTEIINITASVPSFSSAFQPYHFKDSSGFVAARDQSFPIYLFFDTSIKVLPDRISFLSVYTAGYEAIKNFELQASDTGLFTGEEVVLLAAMHPDANSSAVTYNITNNNIKYNHFRLKFIDYYTGNGGGEIVIKEFKMYRNNNIVGDSITSPETGWKRIDDSEIGNNFINGEYLINSNMYNGSFLMMNGEGSKEISFKFKGTKLRLISEWYANRSQNIKIDIDNLPTETFSQYIASGNPFQVIGYEKEGLEDIVHDVKIYSNDLYSLDAIDLDESGYIDSFFIGCSVINNANFPSLLDITFSKNITSLNILINNESKLLLSGININLYKYNLDKIWDELLYDTNYNIIVSTDKGDSNVYTIIKPSPEISLYNNIYTNKDITVNYTINPSYDNTNTPLLYTYNISLDGELLSASDESSNQQISSSITIPYNKLIKGNYTFITDRNLIFSKLNSDGQTINFNIPIRINPRRMFSKYFNGVNSNITIKNWTKPLSELVIQVVKKSSIDSNFIVITDNTLVSLVGSELKIGGISTFTGNIYEVRIWEKGFEQPYTYDQLYGNEYKLYALYTLNEYNSKNIYDNCGKFHGTYTGELINQDIVPNNISHLTIPIIDCENGIVKQKEDYSYEYNIESPKSYFFNSLNNKNNVVIDHIEINIPNKIININKLLIRKPFDTNFKVGDIILQPEFGWKRIDDRDANIIYSKSTRTNISSAYNNTCTQVDNTITTTIKFSFFGSILRIIGRTYPTYPAGLEINIDNSIVETFTSVGSDKWQVILYQNINLSKDIHNVSITCPVNNLGFTLDAIDINQDGYLLPIS